MVDGLMHFALRNVLKNFLRVISLNMSVTAHVKVTTYYIDQAISCMNCSSS